MNESRLFMPLKIGNIEVKNRIGMAGLSRFRADEDHVPTELMKEYYYQRTSVPGTLLITEPTLISKEDGGLRNEPMRASFIFAQLSAMGRAEGQQVSGKEDIFTRSSSAAPLSTSFPLSKALTTKGIKDTVQNFVRATKNAVDAGFDGVEILCANGDFMDTFFQEDTNKRDDEYGRGVENTRFMHEIMKAVSHAIGVKRVGLCLGLQSTFQSIKMRNDQVNQLVDIVKRADIMEIAEWNGVRDAKRLEFVCNAFRGPILIAVGYKSKLARKLVDEQRPDKDIMFMFGRYFTSNPDLVLRIQQDLDFTPYNEQDLYVSKSFMGYTDYEFSKEYLGSLNVLTQLLR
ncbi:FMN-linked oxidoreductase [Trichoderma barbatum]